MDVAKALRIVIDTAAPSCDAAALNPLRRLFDQASPLLALAIEDCADRAAHAAAVTQDPGARCALARALRHACSAAIARIPSIDQRRTRNEAKQALKAVATLERLAAILAAPDRIARERAA
jgi:hypothetical protein